MRVVHGSKTYLAESADDDVRPVATIGNFDGVHLGHRVLLDRLIERAGELEAPALVYTFDPPPRKVLQPETCPPRVHTLAENLRLLEAAGVDIVVVEAFSREFGSHPPEWFASEILGRLDPQAMVVGYDFRYGRGRRGNIDTLREHRPGLPVEAVEARELGDGTTVSSSRIREAVASGDMVRAASLLGRPFHLVGVVEQGDQRGRLLGFPTANLTRTSELLPAPGVYAVRTGDDRPAVVNIGIRPTFDTRRMTIEAHLLDFSGDLYGTELSLHFIARLRGEVRFGGPDALKAQIAQDITAAREIL
ncbi:MAG: riboflavin biosynthesis protein RibF [Proteobacteria bacterium]|nr:riboflavin biosynthesis protein RibF [Pseudomonadota bacterium]MCP4920797.1 riboflavin biosynthesis protein RibF [Pseudomonadota bacterium]